MIAALGILKYYFLSYKWQLIVKKVYCDNRVYILSMNNVKLML